MQSQDPRSEKQAEDNNHVTTQDESDLSDVEYIDPSNNDSQITKHTSVEYSGPLPPAAEMERYAQIDPSFAERIIKMAENEASHRHQTDHIIIEHQAADIKRGQQFALTIGLAGFLFSAYALYLDRAWVASLFGGGTLVLLVTAFIRGRKK